MFRFLLEYCSNLFELFMNIYIYICDVNKEYLE